MAMAHRGRLNILTNILHKPYKAVMAEFKGINDISKNKQASGDVKYHMGYSNYRNFKDKKILVELSHNPSHLESVNPILIGKVAGRQAMLNDIEFNKAFGILIHGDAAIAGQGVVQESLCFNDVEGYNTGGTIHIVTNNQIGFTTNKINAHSSRYVTNIMKMLNIPIFHVNAEDAEAVYNVAKLAFEYKLFFKEDVIIDIIGYRKYGHNEGDEPSYTQPKMYEIIRAKESIPSIYSKKLLKEAEEK